MNFEGRTMSACYSSDEAGLSRCRSLLVDLLSRTWWTLMALLVWVSGTCGFNIDTRSAIVHQGEKGSMFGYAVSVHRDNDFSWLLVGAPKAQTDQPGVNESGAVFRCSIDSPDICQLIPFDRSGPGKIILRGRKEDIDMKSHQWFGATVHSSGENGAIVACAPRYVYFSSNLKRRDPVGTCWVVRSSFTNFQEYSPCRTTAWGYHRQGSGQAGFSAAVSKDGRRLFIGAVGSWYWQGQLFSQDLHSKQSLLSTAEAPEYDDDSYLGYSMALGEFTGDKDQDVVVGVPRGNKLVGKIALFSSELRTLVNISGEQLGSYFGYSVCVTDLNGDGLDDIAVGAPFYTDLTAKDGSYEKGRVYIIYQNKQHQFLIQNHIDGTYSRGRFGLSLAHVADINGDGFNDLAVGCPYGGENGKGLVYLFHGGSNGITTDSAQKITSEEITGFRSISTFGWSLSGGLDLDNNQYPDLLIGAYESDKVIFLRSRPVIKVSASLKITPEKINLDDKGCRLDNQVLVPCVVVAFCLEFTGIGVQPFVSFVYRTSLDVHSSAPRVFFLKEENQNQQNVSVNLRKESKYCKNVYAYIQNNVRDKLTPIAVQVLYELYDPYPNSAHLKPILDKSVSNNLTKQVNIQKNCGKDNICIPDIKLQLVPNMHQFLIGNDKKLELHVVLVNDGEDAFEAMLYGTLPVDVDYVNVAKVRPMDIPVSCSESKSVNGSDKVLTCYVGNPLPANTTLTFKIILAPSKFLSASNDLQFNFVVNSTNEELEENLYDNQLTITLPVRVEVNITIHGISDPQTVAYNKTEVRIQPKNTESQAGPEVIHVYAVGNRGPSTVTEAEIDILWPTYTLQRRPLLYLMDQPEVLGKGECKKIPDVNPFFLKVEQKRPRSSSYSVSIDSLEPYPSIPNSVIHIFGDAYERQVSRERRLAKENASSNEMACGPTLCTKISCRVYDLAKNDQVIFTIRSRLWKDTLVEMGFDEVQISSKLVSRVTSLPHDVDPSYIDSRMFFVTTKVNPESVSLRIHVIPWWVIIVSVSAGLILLGLLALLLWWLGFFRRLRPNDQWREPLHNKYKNDYHMSNGDEYL